MRHLLRLALLLSVLLPSFVTAEEAEKKVEAHGSLEAAASANAGATATSGAASSAASPQSAALPQAQASPSGSFQWSYPINLPAGTNGLQPSLSLTYNSAVGNGMLGMGFSLTGLSTIERDPSRGINFTSTDSYLLDGQKLYFDAADTINKLFHPERETYDKIQAFATSSPSTPIANPNTSNSFWVVTKKDGTKLFYGETEDSRIAAVDRTGTRLWALNKVMDTNGNYYTVSYLEEATGAYYPLKIVYTLGNGLATTKTVQFSYEARTDHGVMYQPSKVDQDKRLKWITVLSGTNSTGSGGTLVRKYRVDYQYSAGTGRSQAVAIQEYGKDGNIPPAGAVGSYSPTGVLLPKVTLGWPGASAGLPAWNWSTPNRMVAEGGRIWMEDVDGDGMSDFVCLQNGGVLYVAHSDGSGFPGTPGSPYGGWDWSSPGRIVADSARLFFADVNGDGKQDFISIQNGGVLYVNFSNGAGYPGTPGSPYGGWDWSSQTRRVTDTAQVWFADVNGDGRADLLSIQNGGILYVDFSNGAGYPGTPGSPYGTWDWCSQSRMVTDTAQVWTADVNGDGRADVLSIQNGGILYVDFSNGTGYPGTPGSPYGGWDWCSQTRMVTDTAQVWTADVNGDGRADVLSIQNGGILYVDLSNGAGYPGTPGSPYGSWDWGSQTRMVTDTAQVWTADVNGDGRADVLSIQNGGILYVDFSKGTGFPGTPGSPYGGWDWSSGGRMVTDTAQVRTGDVNGDGGVDFLALQNGGLVYVSHQASVPEVVSRITLPTGGTITATYTPATRVTGAIVPANSNYTTGVANSSPRPLVTKIVVDPKLAGMAPISTSYQYKNALSLPGLPQDRTDLGFKTILQTDDNTGTKSTTTFSQLPPLQGMVLDTLVTNQSGSLKYSQVLNTYGTPRVDNANLPKVMFFFQTSQRKKSYDSQSGSTGTSETYQYDPLGNLLQKVSKGYEAAGVDQSDYDNTREVYTYSTSGPLRITKKQVYAYNDAVTPVEGLASETSYFYDNQAEGVVTKGQLTKVQSKADGTTSVASTMAYDAWGNVTDAYDASGIRTSHYTYDSTYHSLVTSTTDARGLVTTITAWDTLQPTTVQDAQGNLSRVVYDEFGRAVKGVSPLPRDSEISPTTRTTFNNTAILPVVVLSEEKTSGSTYLSSYTYYDGLGRVVQTKALAKVGGQYLTVDRYYDASGRNDAVSNPYLTSSSAYSYSAAKRTDASQKKTVFTYDAVGRVIQTTAPDGTLARTEYLRHIVRSIDALGHVTEREVKGNVSYQRSYTGVYPSQTLYTTVTVKNTLGKTVIEDAAGNKITTLFDQIGRKTSYFDPDMGTWTYVYNLNGSLLQQTDAKGNVLNFTYDTAGRVLTKKQGTTTVATYTYGTTGTQNGLLTAITQGSNTTGYVYDQYGRTTSVSKTLAPWGTKTMTLTYNADGRLATKQFPGSTETLTYGYSAEGQLNTLNGIDTYLSSVGLDSFGRLATQNWGNGTATTATFDPVSFRTTDLVTPGVLNLHYDYYADGSVWKKTESTNTAANEIYTYDELNRLQFASGIYGAKAYNYDQLNNLLGQTTPATNVYNSTRPHAISSDGTYSYLYDANGNMTERKLGGATDRSYVYDAENRLTSATVGGQTTSYTYDDTRQRTTMTVGTVTTVFWFDDYEETYFGAALTDVTRSYAALGKKFAQRSTVTGLVYLYSDHLGSTSKTRDQNGVVKSMYYEPFGKLAASYDGTVREMFTGQEWDGSADLYYYNARYYSAALGRFIQADPALADRQYTSRLSLTERMNPYLYCNDNPVNFADPTGMWVIDLFFIKISGGEHAGGGLSVQLGIPGLAQTYIGYNDAQGLNLGASVSIGSFTLASVDLYAGWDDGLFFGSGISVLGVSVNSHLYLTGDEISIGVDSDIFGVPLLGVNVGAYRDDSGNWVGFGDAYATPLFSAYADTAGNSQYVFGGYAWNSGAFGDQDGFLFDQTYGGNAGSGRYGKPATDQVDALAVEHDSIFRDGNISRADIYSGGKARQMLASRHRHLKPYERVGLRNLKILEPVGYILFLATGGTY